MMRLSISTWFLDAIPGMTTETCLATLKETGFDYIDLALIVPQERKPGTLEQIVHDLEAELYSADSAERNE